MDIEKAKHYSLAEVVLFAIFALGLALAWAMVKVRSHTPLTAPISLDGWGLSVSVPAGTGWDHTEWSYESDNSMTLLAQRRLGRRAEIEIRWRCMIAVEPRTLDEVLSERLTGSNAEAKPLKMPEGSLMQAAQVSTPLQFQEPMYYIAWAALPDARAVELQVIPAADYDPFYAESLLRDMAMSLLYQPSEEMTAGAVLLDRFWRTLEPEAERQEAFVIQEGRGRATGFFYAKHAAGDASALRRIETRQYDSRKFMLESTFTAGRAAEPLQWETRFTVPMAAGVRRYDIRNKDGVLLVSSSVDGSRTLRPQTFVLPEPLLVEYATLYLQTSEASAVTLALAGTGQLVPARFKRIDAAEAAVDVTGVANIVRVEYLHAADFFDELYFDEQGRLVTRFERQGERSDRLWQKSDAATLRQLFGEQFDGRPDGRSKPKTYF